VGNSNGAGHGLGRSSFNREERSCRGALANEGIESLDGKFKEVRDAAIECGLGEHFSLSYKVLSKFAHPTAMRILAPPKDKTEAVQREVFYSQGCLFFTGAFHALERELMPGPGGAFNWLDVI
jgi:hypothetical protein